MTPYAARIAQELRIRPAQVEAVADLLATDATVPFIARYRKEMTDSLDEVAIAAIRDRLDALAELDKRRAAILESLSERDLLSPELEKAVAQAESMTALEDIYLPYRPKRRTRAMMARERGLEPLADLLLIHKGDPETIAQPFVQPETVPDVHAALAGARDILAERFAEDARIRERMRDFFARKALLNTAVVKGKEAEGAKFRDYFSWNEPASKAPSHRLLAVLRGEAEGVLRLVFRPEDEGEAKTLLYRACERAGNVGELKKSADDAYSRLLAPSMENELRAELKQRADAEAIRVFADNARQLLLAPPLGPKTILAIDPGFRTGCKITCLSPEGRLLEYLIINPHAGSQAERERAGQELLRLARVHHIEAVAVGNGTAGRETEAFVRELPHWDTSIPVIMVSESGASVYSASELARKEFPDLDLTYRGAISIGRRLADPLAELVKIDPKAIGVGQYQHDVNQQQLKHSLDDVVVSCVNKVGVELNTASEPLLSYVSGLGPTLARNIVAYRHEHGMFSSRKELLDVSRLGPKAFEQAAGFLRVAESADPLDRTAVHPERYALVKRMAKDAGANVSVLMADATLRSRIDLAAYVTEEVGLPTLRDIMDELDKPGRDPRGAFTPFAFSNQVRSPEDLISGMRLPGIVTNVTAFGAFVDIGVHQDGLVHISQLADRFVKDPNDVVRVQQEVFVTVLDVDMARKRISLSMRSGEIAQSKK